MAPMTVGINAAYNPTPAVYHSSGPYNGPSAGTVLLWFFVITVMGLVVWAAVWFVFIRKT